MPKIDPITGCEVLTASEFWRAEAASEGLGRTASDVADDFYADMEREIERETRRLHDPSEALVTFKAYDEQEESRLRLGGGIVSVRRVIRASFHQSVRSSKSSIVAEVQCVDGISRFVRWIASSWDGGRMDPPEYDEGMEELSAADVGEVQ